MFLHVPSQAPEQDSLQVPSQLPAQAAVQPFAQRPSHVPAQVPEQLPSHALLIWCADKNRGFDNSAVAAKIGKTFSNELLKNSRRDWMFEKSCSTIY